MKILVTGHWYRPAEGDVYALLEKEHQTFQGQGCEEQQRLDVSLDVAPSSGQALEAVREGIVEVAPDAQVECVLFGAGADFIGSMAESGPKGHHAMSVPQHCVDAYQLGVDVSTAVEAGKQVALEAGHLQTASVWESFLEGALGLTPGTLVDSAIPDDTAVEALCRLRDLWVQRPPLMVVSTQRPFIGLSSTLALTPSLNLRSDVSANYTGALRRVFDAAYQRNCQTFSLVSETLSPVSVAGSGAGGGIAAVIVAIGGRLIEAGEYLSAALQLTSVMDGCDVVVVLEPELHSPLLAEAQLDAITRAAGECALPVVAVGVDSSLSRHESAQWGLHGVMLAADNAQALRNIGMRIAHTWLRRVRR